MLIASSPNSRQFSVQNFDIVSLGDNDVLRDEANHNNGGDGSNAALEDYDENYRHLATNTNIKHKKRE